MATRSPWALPSVLVVLALTLAVPAAAQQRGSISGRILDSTGAALPGATVTVVDQNTGFMRTVVTAVNGAYTAAGLEPGIYTVSVELAGFNTFKRENIRLTAGTEMTLDQSLQIAGIAEELIVTADAPLVERTSSRIGGTLSSSEIEDVPSNFRNFTALTQLIPGMTPNPAQSSFEGGQVTANGVPAQSNVYLLDGMYNNDDRLGGSQGTQVRVVLDNIEEYQVLANQYSAEYGGGAGAIINMVSRGGSNRFSGRAYTFFRDDTFNARGFFLPESEPKPPERTLQSGVALGGPVVRNKAFFYFTVEHDQEDLAGTKRFPAEAAPLATDFVGTFSVRANNYFGRGDVQLNDSNFLNARWVLETAPSRGEGFNTSNETIDAQGWESDWDHLFNVAYTSVLTDRASNIVRVGRIGEQLGTGAQTFFDEDVNYIGFNGRDPFTLGQSNAHPSYITGKGGEGQNTRIRTYLVEDSFSYFAPNKAGDHTLKFGGGFSYNSAPDRASTSSGTFTFDNDAPFDPTDRSTYPFQFDITVGPPGQDFAVSSIDHRYNLFIEDKWQINRLTLNLGLRYDHQKQIPGDQKNFGPRAGFAYDLFGTGRTVLHGGFGRFYSYMPISVLLNLQTGGVNTLYPSLTITDPLSAILNPAMVTDSQGHPGVAVLSQAGIAELTARRDALLAGSTFSRDPRVDDPNRRMPFQYAWSLGVSRELGANTALNVDYVANASRQQNGVMDINEPINGIRPGVDVFDPDHTLIPEAARDTNFRRVLQNQSRDELNGDYKSLQVSFQRRMANRWGGRLAYTLQDSNYVGLGNPDTRRVWLDNDIEADYGRFASDRRHVLAASGTLNPWRELTLAAVVSAISGSPINETIGVDANHDTDSNNDRPMAGVDDLVRPIVSDLDDQGRAVINGIDGPDSFTLDASVRYSIPVLRQNTSIDLFYDVFNLTNHENLVPPTGNRRSGSFLTSTAARFARQQQFGVRFRF